MVKSMRFLLALLRLFLISATVALAVVPAASGDDAKPKKQPDASAIERAKRHFDHALELYQQHALEEALLEFERAYQLAPSYKILYNLGLIHRELNHHAEALKAFRQYLNDGGSEISDERRLSVEQAIREIVPRVATIEIATNVEGADVRVDDLDVGQSPLRSPVTVNPGRRRITASKTGYLPETKMVTVVGSDSVRVQLTLQSSRPAPVDPAPRNYAIVSWSITAALTGVAIVMGVLAINANDEFDSARDTNPNPNAQELVDMRNKVTLYAALADGFAAAAAVGGGISIYLTVRAAIQASDNEADTGFALGLRGRF
jgi:hypothetical protein